MGGFAEEALLDSRITRKRGDVDFLVPEDRWATIRTELQNIGLRRFEQLLTQPDGRSLAFVSRELGLAVEVWPARRETHGYALILPSTTGFFRLRLPVYTFDAAGAVLDGVRVKPVSPRALALLRAVSATTRGDAAAKAEDMHVFQRIVEKLLPTEAAEAVILQMTELPAP